MSSTVAHNARLFGGIGLVAASVLTGSMALAQPLAIRVNPHLADEGILMSGNQPATMQTLFMPARATPKRMGAGSKVGAEAPSRTGSRSARSRTSPSLA